jgi:hypothetical protein
LSEFARSALREHLERIHLVDVYEILWNEVSRHDLAKVLRDDGLHFYRVFRRANNSALLFRAVNRLCRRRGKLAIPGPVAPARGSHRAALARLREL